MHTSLTYQFFLKSVRDAVMWLNAFGASIHHVYFGTDKSNVADAFTRETFGLFKPSETKLMMKNAKKRKNGS